jgi:two-component system, cell cycle response regulator CpdR
MARILVADDEESLRHFLSRALTARGHEVVTVGAGTEALDALAQGPFDLLLSDVVMPELDGIALALRVSRDHPQMPIIMMTGFMSAKARAEDLSTLVRRVVSKPFTLDDICRYVDEALAAPAAA